MPRPEQDRAGEPLLCPSSQPEFEDCRVLGIVQQGPEGPEVAYLKEYLPASPEVLAMAAPAPPTAVFRLAATCQTHSCPHFDGSDCRLATRIVQILPAVVSNLPACLIRQECRWFHQEGGAACQRCPQIVTTNFAASETLQQVVGVPPFAADGRSSSA